ncbi:MAG: CBO2463/CBO2479 domain-containing protein [Coprococcus sp.]
MKKPDYIINPVMMGGLVKEVKEDMVKVHLHGRLGVITVPKPFVFENIRLEPGHEMQFYFSYLQVNEHPWDYDSSAIWRNRSMEPCLVGGVITEVNDTAVKADIMDGMGTVAVPRRFVFTDLPLEMGQTVEFYFSPMHVTGKRDIPAESI